MILCKYSRHVHVDLRTCTPPCNSKRPLLNQSPRHVLPPVAHTCDPWHSLSIQSAAITQRRKRLNYCWIPLWVTHVSHHGPHRRDIELLRSRQMQRQLRYCRDSPREVYGVSPAFHKLWSFSQTCWPTFPRQLIFLVPRHTYGTLNASLLISLFHWAEARVKIARMTLTAKLDGNWNSFQLANNTPPLGVTGSVIAPSARIEDVTCATRESNAKLKRLLCVMVLGVGPLATRSRTNDCPVGPYRRHM